MYILGISAFAHDSSACLLKDGLPVAAAEEERFNRVKHSVEFPRGAIAFCLREAGIEARELDQIAFSWRPFLGLGRRATLLLRYSYRGIGCSDVQAAKWLKIVRLRRYLNDTFRLDGRLPPVHFLPHHLCHAASVFYASPFERSAILSIDAVGEWATTVFGVGEGDTIDFYRAVNYPHSVGFLYAALTQYLGFKACSGEGKVMGLAPYGEPTYREAFAKLAWIDRHGDVRLDLSYFQHHLGQKVYYSPRLVEAFGPPRQPESEIEQRHKDLAWAVQNTCEELVLNLCRQLAADTGRKELCLAGGVALNSVANGRIVPETPFQRISVQPAANDAGGALGAALFLAREMCGEPGRYVMDHAFLGPQFDDAAAEAALKERGLPFRRAADVAGETALLLAQGKIVGWFQGRMEWGPRALGNRSILAHPGPPEMKDRLNAKVKHRESFRPFAPSVRRECAGEYFESELESPFMLLVAPVRPEKRAAVPAITHVDGSARIQTVTRAQNPLYYALLEAFQRQTGLPVLLNTSFNIRGQPIVCTPAEAVECYATTGMDALAMGNLIAEKGATGA